MRSSDVTVNNDVNRCVRLHYAERISRQYDFYKTSWHLGQTKTKKKIEQTPRELFFVRKVRSDESCTGWMGEFTKKFRLSDIVLSNAKVKMWELETRNSPRVTSQPRIIRYRPVFALITKINGFAYETCAVFENEIRNERPAGLCLAESLSARFVVRYRDKSNICYLFFYVRKHDNSHCTTRRV